MVGPELRFATDEGAVLVQQPRQDSQRSRVHCLVSGAAFDIRRLCASPGSSSGLVSLEALEAVQREADFAERAGRHPNIVRCHGVLVQNEGAIHSKLLLCEPCVFDLATHTSGSSLPSREVADVGQELAFGLGHLHNLGILYGGFDATGILRGHDGLWKLHDFCRAALLPVAASEWKKRTRWRKQEAPPEARGSTDDALKPEADVWLLASFLSSLVSGFAQGSGALAMSPQQLLDASVARLWLLLHWLMAEAPEERPCAGEAAALLGALAFTPPQEILAEMPWREQRRVCSIAVAAARQRAVDLAVAEPWDIAELSLERLRALAGEINQILDNCGLDAAFKLDDAPEPKSEPVPAPCAGFCQKQASDIADASTNASGMSDECPEGKSASPKGASKQADTADLLDLS